MTTSHSQISIWGNGLALRLTKPMAKAAGVTAGTRVRIVSNPWRIVIEADTEPTLDAILAAFDPKRHGAAMAFAPVGVEVL